MTEPSRPTASGRMQTAVTDRLHGVVARSPGEHSSPGRLLVDRELVLIKLG